MREKCSLATFAVFSSETISHSDGKECSNSNIAVSSFEILPFLVVLESFCVAVRKGLMGKGTANRKGSREVTSAFWMSASPSSSMLSLSVAALTSPFPPLPLIAFDANNFIALVFVAKEEKEDTLDLIRTRGRIPFSCNVFAWSLSWKASKDIPSAVRGFSLLRIFFLGELAGMFSGETALQTLQNESVNIKCHCKYENIYQEMISRH